MDQRYGRLSEPQRQLECSVMLERLGRIAELYHRVSASDRKRSRETRDSSRLEPEPELETGPCLAGSSPFTSLHKHFECTLLVFLSSRHFSHWDTGRPLRLISKSCRSVWLHKEVRCPLMQDSLMRVPCERCRPEMEEKDEKGTMQTFYP